MSVTDATIYSALEYYKKLYQNKYGKPNNINKYKERWGMKSLLEDFGIDNVKKVLEYYFICTKDGHPLNWFYSNYDTLSESLANNTRDKELREERRRQTMQIRQEYLNGIS